MTGAIAGLGTIKSGDWLDVEADPNTKACGGPVRYTERLSTTKGTLIVSAVGPRLCVGAIGVVHRTYTVLDATGGLRRLRGRGAITLTILSSGAEETWTLPRP